MDTKAAALATEARILDTTERRRWIRDQTGVDTNHSNLQRFGHTVASLKVFREEISSKPNVSVVCKLDNFGLSLKGEETGDRAKGFFVGKLHVALHVTDNCRLVEVVTKIGQLLASCHDFATLLHGIIDVGLDFGNGAVVDERAMGHAIAVASTDLKAIDLGCEGFGELVVDALLDVDAVGANASLAR